MGVRARIVAAVEALLPTAPLPGFRVRDVLERLSSDGRDWSDASVRDALLALVSLGRVEVSGPNRARRYALVDGAAPPSPSPPLPRARFSSRATPAESSAMPRGFVVYPDPASVDSAYAALRLASGGVGYSDVSAAELARESVVAPSSPRRVRSVTAAFFGDPDPSRFELAERVAHRTSRSVSLSPLSLSQPRR